MEPIAQDPALSLRQRKQYWYFQMRSPAGLGVEATLAEINKKITKHTQSQGLVRPWHDTIDTSILYKGHCYGILV